VLEYGIYSLALLLRVFVTMRIVIKISIGNNVLLLLLQHVPECSWVIGTLIKSKLLHYATESSLLTMMEGIFKGSRMNGLLFHGIRKIFHGKTTTHKFHLNLLLGHLGAKLNWRG
jgi:hypothetical protein